MNRRQWSQAYDAGRSARVAECIALLTDLYAPPVTLRERQEHAQLVAREMARAEARRREPSPQLELAE